jgi:hypothetical protein
MTAINMWYAVLWLLAISLYLMLKLKKIPTFFINFVNKNRIKFNENYLLKNNICLLSLLCDITLREIWVHKVVKLVF